MKRASSPPDATFIKGRERVSPDWRPRGIRRDQSPCVPGRDGIGIDSGLEAGASSLSGGNSAATALSRSRAAAMRWALSVLAAVSKPAVASFARAARRFSSLAPSPIALSSLSKRSSVSGNCSTEHLYFRAAARNANNRSSAFSRHAHRRRRSAALRRAPTRLRSPRPRAGRGPGTRIEPAARLIAAALQLAQSRVDASGKGAALMKRCFRLAQARTKTARHSS